MRSVISPHTSVAAGGVFLPLRRPLPPSESPGDAEEVAPEGPPGGEDGGLFRRRQHWRPRLPEGRVEARQEGPRDGGAGAAVGAGGAGARGGVGGPSSSEQQRRELLGGPVPGGGGPPPPPPGSPVAAPSPAGFLLGCCSGQRREEDPGFSGAEVPAVRLRRLPRLDGGAAGLGLGGGAGAQGPQGAAGARRRRRLRRLRRSVGAGDASSAQAPPRTAGSLPGQRHARRLAEDQDPASRALLHRSLPRETWQLLEIIQKEDVSLKAILTTHHHWDHARGNEELAQLYPGLAVYGGDERVGALTHRVTHNEELKFGSINVRCLLTPGHTAGHVCYFVWEDDSPDAPAAFTGDTLFVGGCGRILEGTPEQMHKNLTDILGALPKETKVFCGHEYTARNLKFALRVEPENETVKERLAWAKLRDDEDLPTVPSTLGEEFLYNPFLRVLEDSVQKFTGKTDPIEVFAALCKARDSFRKPKEMLNPQAMLAFEWGSLIHSWRRSEPPLSLYS